MSFEFGMMLVALFGLGSVTGSAIGGWISDRIDPMRVQRWTLVMTAGLMLAPLFP